VIGTAGRQGQRLVRDLGVEDAIDHTREDFREAVRELCPGGVDVVLDTLGGEVQARSLEVVRPGGRLVSVISPPDPALAAARHVVPDYVFISPSVRDLDALGALVASGRLRPHVERIYPLEAAAEAQIASQAGHVHGKLVLNL
jgi:NADPH:quinone reductase-like Zn-dependent oxidoreductase